MKIGFIGQGFIGKNYADDFEKRGYSVVRYTKNKPYSDNKEKLNDCKIIFVAVPTPTTPEGFDDSILRSVFKDIKPETTVVIKSTLIPGTTEKIQEENPYLYVLHSPEFLREVTAADDAAHPERNIVGIPVDNDKFMEAARKVINILPRAEYNLICTAKEAELIKYGGNNMLYFKVMFTNILYDIAQSYGCDWGTIKEALIADKRIGDSHFDPEHKGGRGAGGHCFIKDFEALSDIYDKEVGDKAGQAVFKALREQNIGLLKKSGKDLDLLEGVYGDLDKYGT